MKYLKRPEMIVLVLTLMCLIFTAGYFVGRGTSHAVVTVAAGSDSSVYASDNVSHSSTETTPVISPSFGTNPEITGSATAQNEITSDRININSATLNQLELLPGIGPVLAKNIVDYRNQIGSFKNVEQIQDVSGIGEKKYDAIKNLICVG